MWIEDPLKAVILATCSIAGAVTLIGVMMMTIDTLLA